MPEYWPRETLAIPYRFSGPDDNKDEWHLIHDFFRGYGYSNRGKRQRVMADDVAQLLGKELFQYVPENDRVKIEALYEQLQDVLRLSDPAK